MDSEVGSSDNESSEGEWVMHSEPSPKPKKSTSGTAAKQKEAPDKGGTKRRRRTDTKSVFAAAEDYEHLTKDNAAEAVAAVPKRKKQSRSDSLAAEPNKQKRQKLGAVAAVPRRKKEKKPQSRHSK